MANGKKDKKRDKHQKMLKELRKKKRVRMTKEWENYPPSWIRLSGTQQSIEARLATNVLPPNRDLLVMALDKLPQDRLGLEWALENCFFYYDTGQVTGRHLDNVSIAGKHVIHLCVDKLLCGLGFVEPEVIVDPLIPLEVSVDENDQHDLIAVLAAVIAHEITHAGLGHSCTTEARHIYEKNRISEGYERAVEACMDMNVSMTQLIEESNLAQERLRSKVTHWRNKKGR